jgi:hypothetical protein
MVRYEPNTIKNILQINSIHDHFHDPKYGCLEQNREKEREEKKSQEKLINYIIPTFISANTRSQDLSGNLCSAV